MEKETLRKIYQLRKIEPDDKWAEQTKKNILQSEKEFSFSSLFSQSAMELVGGFAMLLIFALFAFPFLSQLEERHYVAMEERMNIEFIQVEEEEEEEMMIAVEEEMKVAGTNEVLTGSAKELGEAEKMLDGVGSQVLGMVADMEDVKGEEGESLKGKLERAIIERRYNDAADIYFLMKEQQ